MRRSRLFIFLGCTALFLLSSPLLSGSSCSQSKHESKEQAQTGLTSQSDEEELALEEEYSLDEEVNYASYEEWEEASNYDLNDETESDNS